MALRARFLFASVLALGSFACRPANPLDWKIHAPTPAKFDAWQDEDLGHLSARERDEFVRAFNFLASTMPAALQPADMNKTGNALCRRLDGRTIRSVILEGYEWETRTLAARISTESDNIIRNAAQTAKIDDPATLQRFERARRAQSEAIERYKSRLAEIERRVAELSTH